MSRDHCLYLVNIISSGIISTATLQRCQYVKGTWFYPVLFCPASLSSSLWAQCLIVFWKVFLMSTWPNALVDRDPPEQHFAGARARLVDMTNPAHHASTPKRPTGKRIKHMKHDYSASWWGLNPLNILPLPSQVLLPKTFFVKTVSLSILAL